MNGSCLLTFDELLRDLAEARRQGRNDVLAIVREALPASDFDEVVSRLSQQERTALSGPWLEVSAPAATVAARSTAPVRASTG